MDKRGGRIFLAPMERRDLIRGRDWFVDAIVGMFDDDDDDDDVFAVDAEAPTSAIERILFSADEINSESSSIKELMVLSWKVWISRFKSEASCWRC